MKGETIRKDSALHGTDSYQPPVLTVLTISPEAGFAASNEQYNDLANDCYTVDGDDDTFVW
mgnify:FL=1